MKKMGRESGGDDEHWLTCEAYGELRQGINPDPCAKGRLEYLQLVQLVRIQLEKLTRGRKTWGSLEPHHTSNIYQIESARVATYYGGTNICVWRKNSRDS